MKTVASIVLLLVAANAQGQIYTGSGLITITQSNASGAGIGPGDSPGFPVTIANPGSYKLGSNLNPPTGVDAIDITADFVTLDLNGYTITGFETCSIVPPNIAATCTSGSFGTGVSSTGDQTTVKNGAIDGFTTGLDLEGDAGNVFKVTLSQNQTGLITGGFGYLVEDVQAFRNFTGILLFDPSVQAHHIFVGFNGSGGLIMASNDGIVSDVTATSNNPDGIDFEGSGLLSTSTSTGNARHGVISPVGPVVVTDVTASSNGADGFYFYIPPPGVQRTLLLNLNAVDNGSYGYELQSTDCYYHVAGAGNSTANLTGGTPLIGTTCF